MTSALAVVSAHGPRLAGPTRPQCWHLRRFLRRRCHQTAENDAFSWCEHQPPGDRADVETGPSSSRRPTPPTVNSDDPRRPPAADPVVPVGQVVRSWAVEALVAAYGGNAHRLLTELADALEASVAYVDRPTVEAHLERPLSDDEGPAAPPQSPAMAFDDPVGEAGTVRTDWIEDRLHRAGVPGHPLRATDGSGPARQPRRR